MFVPVIALLAILCFWPRELMCKIILALFCVNTICLYTFQLSYIVKNQHASKDDYKIQNDTTWLFGMQVYYGAASDLFPQQYECLIILVMGLCLQWPQSLSPSQGTAPEADS